MTDRSERAGFTLFEMMVSIAIFALAGTICLENYLINIRNARILRDTQTAVLLSRRTAEELKAEPPEEWGEGGSFPAPDDAFVWTLSFSDVTLDESGESTYAVGTIAVSWPEGSVSFPVPLIRESPREETP